MTVTAQQLTDNPRSKELRSISLKLAKELEATVGGGMPSQQKRDILELVEKLRRKDITPDMHVGQPKEVFSDPVVMAEYVAGQLMASIGSRKDDLFIDFLVMRSVLNCVYRFLDAE